MDENQIGRLLAEQYGLERPFALVPIVNGDWNTIYRVEGGKSWIVRISHRRKEPAQLAFELQVIGRLATHLQYVPAVVPTRSGRQAADFDGRPLTVFQRMPGTMPVRSIETTELAGATLGEIHRTLASHAADLQHIGGYSLINFDWHENTFFSGDALAAAPDTLADELSYLRRMRRRVQTWLVNCRNEQRLTTGIVHGDFYRRNILVDGERISGVIDWDEATTSWLEYEVANAAWEFARDDARLRHSSDRFDRFLFAYRSANPLLAIDETTLLWLIAVRRLIEIQLDLFEWHRQGTYDLAYCRMNIDYLHNLNLF